MLEQSIKTFTDEQILDMARSCRSMNDFCKKMNVGYQSVRYNLIKRGLKENVNYIISTNKHNKSKDYFTFFAPGF